MRLLFRFIPAFAALLWCAVLRCEVSPRTMMERYQYYEAHPKEDPGPETMARVGNVKFVVIAGLAGEYIPDYFGDARRTWLRLTGTAREKDPAKKRVYFLSPSSWNSPSENVDVVMSQLKSILESSPPGTKLAVTGHSMGAYTLYLLMQRYPQFVHEHFAGSGLVQGPYGGSELANHIRSNAPTSVFGSFAANPVMFGVRAALLAPYRLLAPAMQYLATDRAPALVAETHQKYGNDADPLIAPKTVVVTSYIDPEIKLRGFARGILHQAITVCADGLSKLAEGPNDGMVRLPDQIPPGLDDRVVVLPGSSHIAFQATRSGRSYAKAFIDMIAGGN